MRELDPRHQALEDEVNRTLAPCPFCKQPAKYQMSIWAGERSIIQCGPCAVVMGETAARNWLDLPTRWNAWAVKQPELSASEASILADFRRRTGRNAAPWPRPDEDKAA